MVSLSQPAVSHCLPPSTTLNSLLAWTWEISQLLIFLTTMKVSSLQILALCLLSISCTSLAQIGKKVMSAILVPPPPTVFRVDLRTGSSSLLPTGVTWHSQLTGNQEECTCDRQGVLKLSFGPTRRRAEINMTFEYSQGWTFNVGDSVTNNGYAGDAGTQDNDAEVHSINNKIFFYGKDNPAGGSYGLLYSRPNFVGVQPYTTLTLNIADELATADNGFDFLYINSYKLFALNGQSDYSPGGVNRDVYLGMNRVVGGTFRNGQGLCHVSVRFYPS